MRDYENCLENVKLLMNDLKAKSLEHYNHLYEFGNICQFMNGKKDIDHETAYTNYIKSKNHKHALKYLFLSVRMMEHQKRFNEITKHLLKATGELNMISYITPMLFEKTSLYYLSMQTPMIKKFCFFQTLAGMAFKNHPNIDLKRYTLHCFGNIIYFFFRNSNSFLKLKEFLNNNMGEISMLIEYYKGALKFYNNCIELSIFKNVEQDQALYIRHFLKSLNSIMNNHPSQLSYINVDELNIPEIINYSLIVIEEQDFEISKAYQWNSFLKYAKVSKDYINLSENDSNIIKNLDNIIDNKQNFSNFNAKRNFKTNVGSKIYVRFLIKNPMNLNLSVSSLKLICEYQDGITDNIELEEQNFLLEKNSTVLKTLYCIPNRPGRIIIKGLEVGLYKIALFKHSFYKKNINELYSKKDKTMDRTIKEISFDVIDEKTDIKVTFPAKEYNLYYNELFMLPLCIKNNANLKIKRFTLFFEDNDISNEKLNNSSLALNNLIFKEIDIPKENEFSINIPICPQMVGTFFLKIIIKFEEEAKFKEIEIRRFILKFIVYSH